jgi:hypothetical protein
MSLPTAGQAQMLADRLALLIKRESPTSTAVIGGAGGNGLDRIGRGQLERVVAVDINPAYIEAVGIRHARRLASLELHCADIQSESLLFEYVDVVAALASLKRHCRAKPAVTAGFSAVDSAVIELSSGKQFSLQTFRA